MKQSICSSGHLEQMWRHSCYLLPSMKYLISIILRSRFPNTTNKLQALMKVCTQLLKAHFSPIASHISQAAIVLFSALPTFPTPEGTFPCIPLLGTQGNAKGNTSPMCRTCFPKRGACGRPPSEKGHIWHPP